MILAALLSTHPARQAAACFLPWPCCPFAWLLYAAHSPTSWVPIRRRRWSAPPATGPCAFLCLVLAVTPLRVITGTPALARFRRMLGLFVYFYALLHLLSYSWFDMGFDLADIAQDIAKRPFILVGFHRLRAAHAAGRHLVQPGGQGLGVQALADAAPAGLCGRRPGDPAFFLDARGQERLCRSGCVCGGPRRAAGLAPGQAPWRNTWLEPIAPAVQAHALPATALTRAWQPSASAAVQALDTHLVGDGFPLRESGATCCRPPAPRRPGRACCSCWPCSCSRRRPTARPAGRPAAPPARGRGRSSRRFRTPGPRLPRSWRRSLARLQRHDLRERPGTSPGAAGRSWPHRRCRSSSARRA